MKTDEGSRFEGFHVHLGEVVGCEGPRTVVPAEEHAFLVREAERFGCGWLASLRHSHPDESSAVTPADGVLRELDVLLGDPTVDDRARWAAKRLRALWDAAGPEAKAFVACGVGSEPHQEPRWTDGGGGEPRIAPGPGIRPIMVDAKSGTARKPPEGPSPAKAGEGSPPEAGQGVEGTSRVEFFAHGAAFRGPGRYRSEPAETRGSRMAMVTAAAGLDPAHPEAGAVCVLEESFDKKHWSEVEGSILSPMGRYATGTLAIRGEWIRLSVEVDVPGAEVPVHASAVLFGRMGEE